MSICLRAMDLTRWLGITTLAVLFAWASGSANAQQVDAGDTCATAGEITAYNAFYGFDTTGASADDPCDPGVPTVWYKFTVPFDGTIFADLCGSSFDTFLSVLDGASCPNNCIPVIDSNDACDLQSAVNFDAIAGETYYFVVSGNSADDFGVGNFNFSYQPELGASDTCAEASEISLPGTYTFDTTGASPDDPCAVVPTIWKKFVAPTDGLVEADLCGSSFDTYLTVFSGASCPDSCVDLVANDNDSCEVASAVSFQAAAGTTYWFAISGNSPTDFGPGYFTFDFFNADTCVYAVDVSAGGTFEFDTTNASADDPCFEGGRTVWYSYTVQMPGTLTLDTCGSDFDTFISVYEGPQCPVVCNGEPDQFNDNGCDGSASALSIETHPGQTLYIAINGSLVDDFGAGQLNVHPPVPGECSAAVELFQSGFHHYDTTTANADDPCAVGVFNSSWVKFTAPNPGFLALRVNDTSYTPFVRVFETESCPTLCEDVIVEGTPEEGPGGFLTCPVEAGETYYVSLSSAAAFQSGFGELEFLFVPGGGDFLGDGTLNVADVTHFARLLADGIDIPVTIGDFNNDSVVDMDDVQELADFIAILP